MSKKFFLIYSNHTNKSTTNNFIEYFEEFFKPYKIILIDKIQVNENNIIIDEFTSDQFINEIKSKVKKFKKTKIILVFTEYFNHNGFKVFNNFDLNYKKLILIQLIMFFTSTLFFIYKIFFKPLNKFNLHNSKKISNQNDSIMKKLLKIYTSKFIVNYKYFKKRYQGFMKVKSLIDSYLIWNEEQKQNLIQNGIDSNKIISIFPYVGQISFKNKHGISISGEVTEYRKELINKFRKKIFISNNFQKFLKEDFYYKDEFFTYSLNPKKEYNWTYPSIFRYLLSINMNEIPIINDNFNCAITKYLTLKLDEDITIEQINNKNYIITAYEKINLKITKYNDQIYHPNKKIFNKHFF